MEDPTRDALIAVYPDDGTAREVAAEVRGRAAAAVVRVDDPHDRVDSLRAEMREELEHSILSPQAGILLPKESTKSLLVAIPLGAVVGAVLLIPLAAVAFDDTSFAALALWAGIIGAVMGGTIAYLVGSAMAIAGPAAQSAGHAGVPVRVEGELTPEVVGVLAAAEPLRIDLVTEEGRPVATLLTEEELSPDGVFERLAAKLTQPPGGDWSSTRVEHLADLQARNREVQRAANDPDRPLADGTTTDSWQASAKDE